MAAASLYASPAGLIPRGKSGNPYENAREHEQRMLRFRDSVRDEARAYRDCHREATNIHSYIDQIEGRHWPKDRRPYRSQLQTNRMAKARIDTLAMLSDIKPTVDVTPNYTGLGNIEQQANIGRMILQSEWVKRGMMLDFVEVVDHALLATGYWKIGGCLPGKLIVSSCGIDNVMPVHPSSKLQDSAAILYTAYKRLTYFMQKWPHRCAGLEKMAVRLPLMNPERRSAYQKRPDMEDYTWKNIAPWMRHKLGQQTPESFPSSTYFPVLPLEEIWFEDFNVNETGGDVRVKDPDLELDQHNWHYVVAPRRRLFPGKRLAVFAGDRLMYDGPSPYWTDLYPFAELNLNPVIWGRGSLSRYRDLVPLNRAMNEIIAGVHELIVRAINPQFFAREGAVRLPAWRQFQPDRAGFKMLLQKNADLQRDLRWSDPPQIPSYVYVMLLQYLVPEFEKMSGLLDISALTKKNQIPGGDTIEQMRDSLQTQLRLESRYIEQFLVDSGTIALSHAFQFFTSGQRLRYFGPDGVTYQDSDYDPGTMVPFGQNKFDHWKLFGLSVAQGSLHGASRDRKKQTAIALYKGGIISRKELLRTLEWSNIDRIERELMEERQEMAQLGMGNDIPGMPRLTRGQRNGEPV